MRSAPKATILAAPRGGGHSVGGDAVEGFYPDYLLTFLEVPSSGLVLFGCETLQTNKERTSRHEIIRGY